MLNSATQAKLDKLFQKLLQRRPENRHLFEIIRTVPYLAQKAYDNLYEPLKPENIINAMMNAHRTENKEFVVLMWDKLKYSLDTKIAQRLLLFYNNDRAEIEDDIVDKDYKNFVKKIKIECEEWLAGENCGDIVNDIINIHHEAKK